MTKFVRETQLAAWAKKARLQAGKSKAAVARELKVAAPTVHQAEENPHLSLTKLRVRMIEKYSPYRIVGPVYLLQR